MRDSLNRNVEGRTPLMHASFEGDLDGVIRLLDEGSDPNARDAGGDTALMFATMGGHFLVVKMLLAHGADPLVRRGTVGRRCASPSPGANMRWPRCSGVRRRRRTATGWRG